MELTEDVLARLIRDVLAERLPEVPTASARVRDASGVTRIDQTLVPLQPFPFPIDAPDGSVRLVDLLTVAESPRLGCGVMELGGVAGQGTSFEWTLTYDEVDYVIDGTLDIVVDGRTTRGTAGQVLYIPKDTTIRFATPDAVRFLYVVYPADWAEQ